MIDKDKTDKKDHILDVAEKVFSDYGFDGASTRKISSEAGVNMAMLNYYFGSKEGLFVAIFERKIASMQIVLQNIGNNESMSSWDKLDMCIDNYVDRIIVNNCFHKIINRELSMDKRWSATDKITDMLLVNAREMRKIFEEGINNGSFYKDTDIQLVTATIFGTKNYLINTPNISSIMLGHDIRDEKYLEEQLKPRFKNYMKRLLKSYLMNNNDNKNQ